MKSFLLILIFFCLVPTFANANAQSTLACSVAVLSIDDAIRSLSALRLKLDIAKAKGSSSIAMSALSNSYRKSEDDFVQYVEQSGIMSRETLVERMKQEIKLLQQGHHAVHDEARTVHQSALEPRSIVIDGSIAVLHYIEPDSFEMGDMHRKSVTLTKPFEMMATPTTQVIWRKIAELANTKLGYQIELDPSTFKGDHNPVEQVSHDDVELWLQALNELSASGEPALPGLIDSHKQGDVYRLPTEAEWEFVLRGRGQHTGDYHFGNLYSRVAEYVWYRDNSQNQTHPVAEKPPLIIDGNEFYDMHGNVREWVSDRWGSVLLGGIDPQGLKPENSDLFVVAGGSWRSSFIDVRAGQRGKGEPSMKDNQTGFRFVRHLDGSVR
ncbi:MAG TPA: formylglycine-generating enzyme family protein [Bdellovibrionales bacterium]|nr:formylglycine-generating enzyme family protein [Bdellovibrionales bacterium]